MPTYVVRSGQVIEKHLAPRPAGLRSSLSAPMIISDHLGDVWNPVNGQTYDSKSAYYRAVRDAGCEVMGNDPAMSRPPVHEEVGGIEADIKQAIEQLTT